jgi:hypothetical protein
VSGAVRMGGQCTRARGSAMLGLLRRILAFLQRLGPVAPDIAPSRGSSTDAADERSADVASPWTLANFPTPARPGEGDGGIGDVGLVDGRDLAGRVASGEPDAGEHDQQSSRPAPWTDGTDEGGPIDLGSAIQASADETSDAMRSEEGLEQSTYQHPKDGHQEISSKQVLADALYEGELNFRSTENDTPRSQGCDDPAVETVAGEKALHYHSAGQAPYEHIVGSCGEVDGATGDAPAATTEVVVTADLEHVDGLLEIAAENQIADDGTDAVDTESVDVELGGAVVGSGVPPGPSDSAPSDSKDDRAHGDAGPATDMISELAEGIPSPSSPLAEAEAGGIGKAPQQQGEASGANAVVGPASGPEDDLPFHANEAAPSGHDVDAIVPRNTVFVGTAPDAIDDAVRRRPGEYRPRLSRARARRPPNTVPTGGSDIQSLGADLQLLVGAADWGVQLAALLRMPAGAADGFAVEHGGAEVWLGQLDDELLEPLALTDASAAFGESLLVTAVSLPVRWSRTSRDLHVLGPDHRVAGFVSQARVVIGQESVVICRRGLASVARAQILATGSPEPIEIEGPNVPKGWVCWRGVRPMRPSLPVGGHSILDALDPLPAVSIDFSGGIQLSRNVWLEGHPPSVRLLGLLSEGDPILIDGQSASINEDGAWVAQGWDAPGVHVVSHGGKSAGYAVEAGAKHWSWWPAWEGATNLAGAVSEGGGGEFFHVGGSAMLLGARPGQVCGFTRSASGIGVARPGFEPVWLLTADSRMRRWTASTAGLLAEPGRPTGSQLAVDRWASAICSSGRAGTDRSAERVIWNRYVAAARSQRKRRR